MYAYGHRWDVVIMPLTFWTSVPEVVEVRENQMGTVTLTVNAVCDMVICDDAYTMHDCLVKFKENWSFSIFEE